jgi:hypothetical protein
MSASFSNFVIANVEATQERNNQWPEEVEGLNP